jgi:hypothetical protein
VQPYSIASSQTFHPTALVAFPIAEGAQMAAVTLEIRVH